MTVEPQGAIPALTLGWRLKMALSHAQVKRSEMAEQLGYEDSQLSRWMSDKATPRKGVITQWALLTGVNPQWLETGAGLPTGGGSPGEDRLSRLANTKRRHAAPDRNLHRYAA